ncbi:GIY-YIG nuclease family protein [Bradyrhizobium yuanmingense]|uniref:GIY-YIG nuclease family protein n=1 Tax=Bradyrhizobium yuanmingense TaxID=108015 RepID=UPI0004B6024F|nr:GIY-YIG nuclease family protein [Bradyrhizobium yuanmingense]
MSRPQTEETFIYLVRAGEFVKIGQSIRWKERLEEIQIGSPYTIVPLLVLVGEPSLERRLHNRFRRDHFRGEWFHFGPAIRAYIKENLKNCVTSKEVKLKPARPSGWDIVL